MANAITRPSTIVMPSDGWTSIKGKSLINFMAVCENTPIYLGTTDSKAESHTGAYVAEMIKSR